MDLSILSDPRLYELLFQIDRDLAEAVRAEGCPCGGLLHRADYPRKPRGALFDPGRQDRRRLSWCCAGCRRRRTPASVRFLGRRVYWGAVVVLVSALAEGLTPRRCQLLRERVGVCLRTLERWRVWWRERFVSSSFWKAARGRFVPPVEEVSVPGAFVDRFAGANEADRLGRILLFLSPLTTSSA